jgi:hypothetical protein
MRGLKIRPVELNLFFCATDLSCFDCVNVWPTCAVECTITATVLKVVVLRVL